ncbi:MAG: hypothetical protein K9H16_04190 [Bacteroidales bacterium]|nr:hypothetical protein [Bacteroidales bacterium]
MKNLMLLFAALIFSSLTLIGQVDKMKDILEDETDTENFTMRFFNALDGQPIIDGNVSIVDAGEFKTDQEGKVKFPRMDDQVLLMTFSADGFITTNIKTEIVAGTIFYNRVSVSPEMALENVRIILDWGRNPDDLDAHLSKDKKYHISYRNMKASEDGEARLDRDDRDGWGPETITIRETQTDAHYEFWVHDFTNQSKENSKKLSKSKAVIKVYANNELQHQISVPDDGRGNAWHVFTIDTGEINLTNYITTK